MKHAGTGLFGAVALLIAQSAFSQPVALWLAHSQSDNLAKTREGGSGSSDGLGVTVDYSKESTRASANVFGTLEHVHYENDVFDSETIGALEASARLVAVPGRFSWLFQDSRRQSRIDPFGPDSPANRESHHSFSTGPELTVPFGARSGMTVSGAYGVTERDNFGELDSSFETYDVHLYRMVSSTTQLGLLGQRSRIEFDSGLPGYEVRSLTATYHRRLVSGEASVQFGTNELDLPGSSTSAPVLLLGWNRSLATRSSMSLSVSREITDASEAFSLSPGPITRETRPSDLLLTSSPLDQYAASIYYVLELERMNVTFGVTSVQQKFEVDERFDNHSSGASFTIERTLAGRTRISLVVDQVRRDFGTAALQYDENARRLLVSHPISRRLSITGFVERQERGGTEPFEERRYSVRFVYTPRRFAG